MLRGGQYTQAAKRERLPCVRQVSHTNFDDWATLRRRGGHRLAVALDMLDMVRSDGVRRADLQRAARLASGRALADEQVPQLQVYVMHACHMCA